MTDDDLPQPSDRIADAATMIADAAEKLETAEQTTDELIVQDMTHQNAVLCRQMARTLTCLTAGEELHGDLDGTVYRLRVDSWDVDPETLGGGDDHELRADGGTSAGWAVDCGDCGASVRVESESDGPLVACPVCSAALDPAWVTEVTR